METKDITGALVRLLPDLYSALKAGVSEEQVRKTLAENRREIDAAFDDAEARIAKPRPGDG